jgi:hypothetical protein
VFGPIFIGGALSAVWALIVLVFPYLFWTALAVGSFIGLWFFGHGLSEKLKQERLERDAEEERRRTAAREREELEALHSQVRNAYHDLFDAERRRSQQAVGP